jgi:hypothetical protein
MGAKLDYTPQYLRGRAQQTRAMARAVVSDATLAMLEKRAAEYDQMAELQERSAGPEVVADETLRSPKKPPSSSNAKRVGIRFEVI